MQTVSVIIPVFNLEGVLADTLKSVLKQTHKDLQIILINDGSNDKSAEICSEYAARDGRILVINKENGGVSTARNAGLDQARGKYARNRFPNRKAHWPARRAEPQRCR